MAQGYDVLINDVNRLLGNEKMFIGAVNSVLVEQKRRIFVNGLDSSSGKIGQYSTNPISISRNKQARNTGKTYFKGGYREYKSLTGKQVDFVTLWDTGQMMMDLGTTVVVKDQYGIGFNNDLNGDKSNWMEDKYKKAIFATTDQEDEIFIKVINYEMEKTL